jgi:hypothetical protein
VNGMALSLMPREGRDASGACVGLVFTQCVLNLHWIIFSRETVATAGGYNKQAKRTPSPTCHTHPQSSVSSAQYFAHPNIFQRGNKSCGKSSRSVSKARIDACCSAAYELAAAGVLVVVVLYVVTRIHRRSGKAPAFTAAAARLPPPLRPPPAPLPARPAPPRQLRSRPPPAAARPPTDPGRVHGCGSRRLVQEPRPRLRLPPGRTTWRGTSSCTAATTCPSRCTPCSVPFTEVTASTPDYTAQASVATNLGSPGLNRLTKIHEVTPAGG